MAKALKTAALVVGAVALVATGIGAAAGVGIGLGLTAGTLSTIASVAAIAGVASGVLSVAAGLTAKKPTTQATGSQTQFAADPDAGIPLAIGRTGTAGNIVARFGWDTRDAGDNDRQAFVSVLSLGPVQEVEPALGVDRVPVYFDGQGRAIGGFAGFMWRTAQVGLLASAALTFGAGAGTPPAWGAQHGLSGKAATTWTLRFDTKSKLYQNGVPAPMNVVKGQFCYDPRKDSTYPGGSGSHRMADPADRAAYDAAVATWEFSECPFLNGLRFVHGYWQRDMADPASNWQRVMGMGAPLAGIDLASFVEGANVAEANGWKAGGVIYSGDDKWASLKAILQAGMGEPLALGAKISCLVNAPKVSLATITEDDVVGECSVGATQSRRDRVNTITPKFRLEENGWQLLPGAPISVAEHVAADRGKRSRAQEYRLIQSASQAGTAVRYDIENAREFGPIVLPCKLFWMGYKPGDCVTANLPEVGLNGQPILLLNRGLAPSSGIVTLTARSETPGKHAFALGQTATPPPTPGVTGAPIVPVPGADAWAITGTSVTANGVTMPALIVTGAVDAGTAQSVTFDYRKFVSGQAEDDGWVGAGVEPVDVNTKAISGVASETAYEVSVRYTVRGVLGRRRVLGPVTVAAYEGIRGADGTSPYNAILSNETHTLPADAAGNVLSYAGAEFTLTVFYGSQDVTGSFALDAVDNPQGLTGPPGYPTYSIDGGFDAAEPSASVTYHFVGRGGTPHAGIRLTKVFSLTKSLGGRNGEPPALISLSASALTARYDTTGNLIPGQAITFGARRQNTTARTLFLLRNANGQAVTAAYPPDQFAAAYGPQFWSAVDPDTITLTEAGIMAVLRDHGGTTGRVTMIASVEGTGLADAVSVSKVQDGARGADGTSPYNAILSNETHTVAADAAGNVLSYAGAEFTLTVFYGSQDVTGSFDLEGSDNPQGLAGPYAYPRFTITAGFDASEPTASVTYRFVGKVGTPHAGIRLTKVFSLAKSLGGADGSSPPLWSLTASAQTVRFNTTGDYIPGQSIRFTFVGENIAPGTTTVWQLKNVDGSVLVQENTAAQFVAVAGSRYWSSPDANTVILNDDGVVEMFRSHGGAPGRWSVGVVPFGRSTFDVVTIQKLQDGAKGADGKNAVNVIPDNETFTVPTDPAGNYSAFPVDVSRGHLRVYDGVTEVTGQCTFTIQNPFYLDGRIDGTGAYYAVGLYADTGYSDLVAIYNGVAYSARLTAAKVKGGAKGTDGINPPLVTVSASPQAIRYDRDNNLSSGPTTFTAELVNAIGPVSWSSAVNHGIYGTPGVTFSGNTMTLSPERMRDVLAYNETYFGVATETIIATASGVSDRVTVTKIKDGANGADSTVPGPQGPSGISAPQPLALTELEGTMDAILLQPDQSVTCSVRLAIRNTYQGGMATSQILYQINRGGWNYLAQGSAYVAPDEPASVSASGTYKNTTPTEVLVAFRVVTDAPGGTEVRTGVSSYLKAV